MPVENALECIKMLDFMAEYLPEDTKDFHD